jgi:glutathione S-transferase
MNGLELVGRSSSHFTRTARIFALELGVPHVFRPVFDITSTDAGQYANNPALKVPILVLPDGPLYGTENICRELVRRATAPQRCVLRGEVADRLVANAEELTLHAMSSEVALITSAMVGDGRPVSPKLRASLENSLRYLDDQLERVLAALPGDRSFSFFEVALYCLVRHLPFRQIMDPGGYLRLADFCTRFDLRESARQTSYRFDAP